jgi:branched-chain amino acid transport system ATP-binding protein
MSPTSGVTDAPSIAVSLREISVQFNGVQALDGVSFDVPEGELFGLLGPNGAGKTTVMNLLSGVVRPHSGELTLFGRPTPAAGLAQRARLGVVRSFQQVRLLEELSVFENVLLGRERFQSRSLVVQVLGLPPSRRIRGADLEATRRILEVLGLTAVADSPVRDLPFGVRRLVDVGRAFAAEPRILLLDEPAAGLDVPSRQALLTAIDDARQSSGATVLLVEHDVDLVRRACENSVVLSGGRVLARGRTADNLTDPEVVRAYFGSEHA